MADTTLAAPGARLGHLDAMRGLAAMAVVLFHHYDGPLETGLPKPIPAAVFEWGHLGVAVFFALSGFVIARSLDSGPPTGRAAGRFLARRYVRLLPPYYASLVVVFAVAGISTVVEGEPFLLEGHPFSWTSLLAHLTLTQEVLGIREFSSVYWSLCDEAIFYLVLTAIMWAVARGNAKRGSGDALIPALALVAPASLALAVWDVSRPYQVSILFYAFLAGAITNWATSGRLPQAVALVYLAACVGVSVIRWDPFAVTVVVTCSLLWWHDRVPGLDRTLGRRPFQLLGKVSYSTYLIHDQVRSVVMFAVLMAMEESYRTSLLGLLVGLPTIVLASWIMWRVVERPSISWSRRLAHPGPRTTDVAAAPIL